MQPLELELFSKTQFKSKLGRILLQHVHGMRPASTPTATLMGGQPGSGKTTLHNIILESNPNTAIVVGDDYRELHPNFAALNDVYGDSVPYTAQFAHQMTEALIEELSRMGYNLAIEGTLRTTEVPLRTNALLKSRGYSTQLYVMAVSAEESLAGTLRRYEEMKACGHTPRATSKEYHDAVVSSLPDNLGLLYKEGAFDRIRVYRRDLQCVYDSVVNVGINPADMMRDMLKSRELPLAARLTAAAISAAQQNAAHIDTASKNKGRER